MKLSDLYSRGRHTEGVWCPIKDERGRETEIAILVQGVDSDFYRDAQKSHRKAILEAVREGKLEELDQDLMDRQVLVSMSLDWRGIEDEFTPELCAELYKEAPYIMDQVDEFIGKRANFTQG